MYILMLIVSKGRHVHFWGERSGGTAEACLTGSMVRKASNGAGCWFTRCVTWYLFYPFPRMFTAGCSPGPMVQEMSCCRATPASLLHPDLSHMGNFKTLPVPFCSSRACCFPLDPQIIRAVFPYDSQRPKSAQGFSDWGRKECCTIPSANTTFRVI